ncbi:MAG: type II toxin-antitoxin system PemK/MazF family toxin [Chloroflexi bacterium]|nr:type II toxin-antitoxin system PemK/MazF family toxin [Chloroflexota bacterium]
MDVARGDIFYADLNPVIGSEQAGVRPVLVVQNDEANARIPTVTVIPITSNLRASRFLFTVFLPASESGLPKDSVALAFQIRTLDRSRLTRKVGRLPDEVMEQVDRALEAHLDL